MPYINEHSCRLIDPGDFIRFFRKHVKDDHDIGDYKATGKPYDLIIGYREDDSSDVQAYRYAKDEWTVEEARKHCKAHKGIEFVPATGTDQGSASMKDDCCRAEIIQDEIQNLEVIMGAIRPHKTATDTELSWDGPGEVAKAPNDEATLKYMHAWVNDAGDPEAKSSYKFPHHKAGTDTAANIRGVNNALARLPNADIPESDKSGVENHLKVHRKDAGLEEQASAESGSDELQNHHRRQAQMIGFSYVLQAFMESPWAILPAKLAVLEEIMIRHVTGEKLDPEEIQERIHGSKRPDDRKAGKIAILELFGTIFPRANLMTNMSGATSAEIFGEKFTELIKDPDIGAIILDVDSPGGQSGGIEELSTKIYESRGKKPIVAVANHVMDSAAYWIATAADEIVITPSGELGSIGVWSVHDDISESLKQQGIKRTLIRAGKYKLNGNPWEPLSEEARTEIQVSVNETYDAFVKNVARNRRVKVSEVRNGYGEGRAVGAQEAIDLGMADHIGTLEETIKRVQKSIFTLTETQRQQADALRIKVNSILKKEK